MPRNTKAKGTRNEHKAMKLFTDLGCAVCRSAASLGLYDFIAYDSRRFYLVQVKSNSWVPRGERELIENDEVPSNAMKIQMRVNDYQRNPDIRVFEEGKWVEYTSVEAVTK